jgi:hypothetical protein
VTALDLTPLTTAEHDALWWRLMQACAQVLDEYEHLASCPPQLAASLYQGATAEQFAALAAELRELLTDCLDAALPPLPWQELGLIGRAMPFWMTDGGDDTR